ncbi:MAG TPA: bifunctional riboflavin kinase/FAD synthetase [Bryobacteraceae bacterium]|nr:bifunctional riboflavin kinase/FAD synthetase [Bryobacteraceae bacterium]
MRVFRSLDEVPADFGPSALTVGNFDGLHTGHRRIMQRVRAVAAERGLKTGVLTFDPHPTRVVAPSRAPRLITTPEQRAALMAEEGIEQVLILPFTWQTAQLSPENFVRRILVEKLGAKAVLVGDNFRFGHKQAGNTVVLAELGRRFGFTTEIISAITVRGKVVSSSAIRALIESGNVSRAARLLGRPHSIVSDVVPGFGIGTRLTVPTLNLTPAGELLPSPGVYITRTTDNSRSWPSITNVGYRPTFDGRILTIETYLLEPLTGDSPARIRLEFLRRVREERRFVNPETLREQILRDVRRAEAYFRRVRKWTRRAHQAKHYT